MTDEQLFHHVDTLIEEIRSRNINHMSLFISGHVMLTDKPGTDNYAYAHGKGMEATYTHYQRMLADRAILETLY